ncbi:MAG: patatin-like phospholipase family protein [Draconibacterium sp.]
MKHFIFILSVLLGFADVFTGCSNSKQQNTFSGPAEGTAILITGAAARIPQEAALLENLYHKKELNNVVFIAGASSGALNAVMLNGILSHKITWAQYSGWLNQITNDSIFQQKTDKLPVDTSPLKKYITRIVNDSLGFYKMKDLPVTTAISITELNMIDIPKKNYRLCSRKINSESDPELDIVDVLMASTAFPVVFPEQKINNAPTLPPKYFADGGMGKDHVPYMGLIDFMRYSKKRVQKVIIVSRKADLEPDVNQELKEVGVHDFRIFNKIGVSLDEILLKGFISGLKEYKEALPELAKKTFVYVPNFKEKFLLLDFNDLEKQYSLTKKWAKKNNLVPLEKYLNKYN